MMQEDALFWFFFFAVILFVLLLVLVKAVLFFRGFYRELKRIDLELDRTDGKERKYWISQKRRLWLSLIPFVRY